MKRLTAFAAILAILTVQTAAFADGFTEPAWYTGNDSDNVSVNADGYDTVLITKVSDGTIVYVNQAAATTFSAAETFLLKTDPEIGKYKVLMGSGSGSKETYFYVGADSNDSGDLYMMRLQNEEQNEDNDTYNIGYYATVTANEYNNTYKSLKVGYNNGSSSKVYGGFPLKDGNYYPTTYSGPGSLYLIFQLNDVSADYVDSVAVYLSDDEVSSSP